MNFSSRVRLFVRCFEDYREVRLLDHFIWCQIYFLESESSEPIGRSRCHAQVIRKPLVHDFHISYCHTELYLLFSGVKIVLLWPKLRLSKINSIKVNTTGMSVEAACQYAEDEVRWKYTLTLHLVIMSPHILLTMRRR